MGLVGCADNQLCCPGLDGASRPALQQFTAYGLLLAGVISSPARWIGPRLVTLSPYLVLVAAVPTLAITAYYAEMFCPGALGLESREDFLAEHTSLYRVYEWCNRETPKDARFCVTWLGLSRLFYLDRIAMTPEGLTKIETAPGANLFSYMENYDLEVSLDRTARFRRPSL